MRTIVVVLIAIGMLMITLEAGAKPAFSTAPGYMSVPVVTINGDPGTYTSGIQGFAGDDNETAYLFGQNQYILKKELGSPATELYDYGSSVFGSFVKLWGETLYFGESSTGSIKSIPTTGGTATDLFTLANNYDCAFNSQTRMFLSANPSWTGNYLYAWWQGMTDPQLIADVGGSSGPITFDSNDNLYYGRSTTYPPGPEDIVYFTAAQVANAITTGTPLTSADWTIYAAGVNAPGGLVFDRNTPIQDLFSTSSGLGTLSRVSAATTDLMGTGTYPGCPRFFGGGRFSAFLDIGGVLVINCTDYNDSYDSTVYLVKPCSQNFILGSGDYTTVGQSDIATFRPSSGLWAIRGVSRLYFGAEGDLPVSGDYNGDGLAAPAIFRPATGLWADSEGGRIYFGARDDIPVPRDFDGDGTADYTVFRPSIGLWALRGISRLYFGSEGDFPVPADYEGGLPDMAIFRPSSGLWAIAGLTRVYFGGAGDLPVSGDYNGDGTVDPGIYRPSSGLWAVRGVTRLYFGSADEEDLPLPLDVDGDGTIEPGIFRPDTGLWAIRGVTRVYFGTEGDFPASR